MKLITLIILVFTASIQAADIAVKVTNTLTPEEKATMLYMLEAENTRRAELETPEAALPTSTNVEIKDSYEILLTATIQRAHASYTETAIEEDGKELLRNWRKLKQAARDAEKADIETKAAAEEASGP